MKKWENIGITIASDVAYDKLIAEIYIDGKFVALISQDDGIDKLKIEFPRTYNPSDICESTNLEMFIDALHNAKEQLLGSV